jgi:predicted CoA-binding protein
MNKTRKKEKTLILGASTNPNRYAFLALQSLKKHKLPVVGVGLKAAEIEGVQIYQEKKYFSDIDTVTMYLGANNQVDYYDYIIQLNPRRVIFNPGTENKELENLLEKNQIEAEIACTLVLLSTKQY